MLQQSALFQWSGRNSTIPGILLSSKCKIQAAFVRGGPSNASHSKPCLAQARNLLSRRPTEAGLCCGLPGEQPAKCPSEESEPSLSIGVMQKYKKKKCEVSTARWYRRGRDLCACLGVPGGRESCSRTFFQEAANSLSHSLTVTPSLS